MITDNWIAESGISSGMTEQSLVNNSVSTLNGESSGMTSGNLVLSDLTRNLPYENYSMNFDGALEYINCGNVYSKHTCLFSACYHIIFSVFIVITVNCDFSQSLAQR